MGPTILFTYLKIILLQCFQFSVFSNNKFNPNTPYVDFIHMTIRRRGRYFQKKKKNYSHRRLGKLGKTSFTQQQFNQFLTQSESICVNYIIHHLFSLVFLPNWEVKKMWAQRDYFPLHFLSLSFFLFNQTRKNAIFHHIFLSLFFILPVFTLTKHTLKLQ